MGIIQDAYRVGLIGFGGMAGHHFSQLSKQNTKARIYAAFDTDPSRLEAARERGLKTYSSLSELLADKDIDIVIVATPNDTHADICKSALEAGKHVLCEKPVCLNCSELTDILETAKRAGKVFTVDHNRRTNRDLILAKNIIDSDVAGKPYIIESRVEGARGTFGWRREKAHGGGMIYDWGVHLIDQMLILFPGEISSIHCRTFSVHYPEIDDCFRLTLEYSDGLCATIEVSTNAFVNHPRWYAQCEHGGFRIDGWDCSGELVCRTEQKKISSGEAVVATAGGPTRTMAPLSPEDVVITPLSAPENVIDNLDPVYTQLISAIEGGSLTITPEQVMRVMKIIDAAFISAESGNAVKGVF